MCIRDRYQRRVHGVKKEKESSEQSFPNSCNRQSQRNNITIQNLPVFELKSLQQKEKSTVLFSEISSKPEADLTFSSGMIKYQAENSAVSKIISLQRPITSSESPNNKSQTLSLEQEENKDCLLYTSDAADDTPCVDLGGRRIIKKKKII
eukprot:TRINITY_DN37333_c0_g1_i4.p1 TRINITY_DN37333_c0_g1~~TRINITY_DN37333_c0_g1_i4.p1  ORF type:complete len:150 (+),score=42.95 TRINITY_DN37333_c0_g1_i4:132-581(+)